ncbi:MAG TPA: NAD(P)H-hydrate dehydratase [Rudaea sp.]|jgi:NAD(P)H-hydrate epimerase|nr:NAD(P)H-hydrate dehydratase [Rudaea sp.]
MAASLYTAAQVREIDRTAISSLGIAGFVLMQRAAAAGWRVLKKHWPNARRIVVLCGPGNNGGDGYLLARTAKDAGLDARVIAVGTPTESSPDALRAHGEWVASGGKIATSTDPIPDADVYIDAMFGTGLKRPLDGFARVLIDHVNRFPTRVLALDVPSGIDSDTGNILRSAVRATATVSFVAHKRGLFTSDALDYRGALVLDSLGLPSDLYERFDADADLLDMAHMSRWLPPRARNSHKGKYGHVLTIGGDNGMAGAVRMAGEAAMRVGAGLTSIATRPENITAINAARPELMAHGCADAASLSALVKRATVIAIGPGLGQSAWSRTMLGAGIVADKPTVIDADALNMLSQKFFPLPHTAVLTPHPGEAARLLATDVPTIESDRFKSARSIADRYRAVVVLKGAGTVIAHPAGPLAVCPWGNPGMSTGGMGDVLTGIIAGLLAQGLNAWRAARLGVALHAQAADVVARNGEAGMIATDLFPHVYMLRNARAADE